ncbi:MAG: hypothetical protein JSU77_12080 [Fidelibacterota bacterium]|nr:MAG: hypothetical protein JSU77_12080 [Candidatus Neomarinimicrobiota bacterium]
MFWNPAGLATLGGAQLAVSANSFSRLWRENQAYRPNRFFVTLPFYLEGLYVPDPANNGVWDYDLAQDTSYIVVYPDLGLDPFSEEAADWQKDTTNFGLNSFAAAVPLKFLDRPVVLALAYRREFGLLDFDRNDTYLDPHLGYREYDFIERVSGIDTVEVSWYRFLRQRSGDLHTINGALALELSKRVKVGIGLGMLFGKTDDLQSLNKVGYFNLYRENRFSFSYDTLDTEITGTSTFQAVELRTGCIVNFTNVSLGFSVTAPHTLTRTWSYETSILPTEQTSPTSDSGTDKLILPAAYALGISFSPAEDFIFALDLERLPYSQARFELTGQDSTVYLWADSRIIRFGVEYKPTDFFSLLAGYQYVPEVFVPDGAAFKDQGTAANRYILGASIRVGRLGRLDIAYDLRELKYYDSYYSNTNYTLETANRLTVEYIYGFK